ncbi:putative subtilisin-like protease [Ophiocordyceps camponoti-leonardi (nom. inval.)]|nr:putative subtilisin-like protease [Ophiocordyceps camponoti-leonardi (nom. inval.)]
MVMAMLAAVSAMAGLASCMAAVEKASTIPEGWQKLQQGPNPTNPILMSFALRQPNVDGLSDAVVQGRHISRDDILAMRQPDAEDIRSVERWLASSGISETKCENDWVHVRTTVGEAEKLLGAKMERYSFQGQPPVIRTTEYFIPDALSKAITFVHPIANFMTPEHDVAASRPVTPQMRRRADDSLSAECQRAIRPRCILDQYQINYKAGEGKSPSRFAIAGFLDQFANYKDTTDFLGKTMQGSIPYSYNFTVQSINGGQNPQDPAKAGSEANLDMQYGMAIGYPTQVTYYSTGGRGVKINDSGEPFPEEYSDNEPYLQMVEYMLDLPDDKLPHVISMSYADDELSVPRPYAERVCGLMGMLTGRGTSIIVASGDGGARGGRNSSCRTNDGSNKDITMATFPGSCPWVTSVGATTNQATPQGAYFSTGGFSQWFRQPTWQKEAVDTYVRDHLKGYLHGYFNPGMRALPDISAVGTQFSTIVGGVPVALDGTSASAPIFAAMIALVNDARLRRGKKPLGWLNKRLYSAEVRKVLTDTMGGTSKGCIFGGKEQGWPAAKGWDAITGLGTPGKFDDFLRVLLP